MFRQFTTSELLAHLREFKFKRKITQWHIHHTWRPNYASFRGNNHQALNQAMRNYHVNTNGWSDIAQHFTLFPDGIWLSGRDLNRDPASISGWNSGAICIEMIGDFDTGRDVMTEAQKLAIYEATEFSVDHLKLMVRFHRDSLTARKTCPGTGINRDVFFKEFTNFTENKLKAQQNVKEEELRVAREKAERVQQLLSSVRIEFVDMVNKETGRVHWANNHANFCLDRGLIGGILNADGTRRFDPESPVTRAQMAVMINRTVEHLEEKIYKIIDER